MLRNGEDLMRVAMAVVWVAVLAVIVTFGTLELAGHVVRLYRSATGCDVCEREPHPPEPAAVP